VYFTIRRIFFTLAMKIDSGNYAGSEGFETERDCRSAKAQALTGRAAHGGAGSA